VLPVGGRRLASKLASEAEALHKWPKRQKDQLAKVQKSFKQQAEANTSECQMQALRAEDKRLAYKVALETKALHKWLKVQKRETQRQGLIEMLRKRLT